MLFYSLFLPCVRVHAKSLQLGLTLCDPIDSSLPGSSVHGILQARILERVAISFSRESSWSRDQIWVSCIPGSLYHLSYQGSPFFCDARMFFFHFFSKFRQFLFHLLLSLYVFSQRLYLYSVFLVCSGDLEYFLFAKEHITVSSLLTTSFQESLK